MAGNMANNQGKRILYILTRIVPLILLAAGVFLLLKATSVTADPAGATILSNVTATGPTYEPDNRSDAGGTITTLGLSVTQQNDKWKAYVGNISGVLTLDDANGFTIFEWAMTDADVTGEVYASRNNSPVWGSIDCANDSTIEGEDSDLGFGATAVDAINRTFNESTHAAVVVAGNTINADTCRSTATFVNDTRQSQSTADFQEILFASGLDIVYVTKLNQNALSYIGEFNASFNHTVDFQLLLADDVTATASTYYFFVEIG